MTRGEIMARIRSEATGPEVRLMTAAGLLGLAFDPWRGDLPGKPDLAFPEARVAVMVNGCFWHACARCRAGRLPKTRRAFWRKKFRRNVARDRRARRLLRDDGWRVLTWWEHEPVERFVSRLLRSIEG